MKFSFKNIDFSAFFINSLTNLMKEKVHFVQVPSPLSTNCGIQIWTTL